MSIGAGGDTAALRTFLGELATSYDATALDDVLELGTLQSEPPRSTHHGEWLPNDVRHVKSDVEAGPDVDVVADAHALLDVFEPERFDAAIAVSVWEHLRYPWECAAQLFAVLRPGAVAYIATHHAFPVHGYPSDYTRWTDDGLAALFEWAGFRVLAKSYAYPCRIQPPIEVTRWNSAAPAFLNVDVCVRVPTWGGLPPHAMEVAP